MRSAPNPWRTGPHEIDGQNVRIPSEDVELKAYLARPKTNGAHAGVLVIHENKGLVPYVRAVADGLASKGFVALAPDLLSREGGTEALTDPINEGPPLLSRSIPRERHLPDLDAALTFLQHQSGVTKVGVIGFCFGGGLTWLLATRRGDLGAAVPFYGPNPPLEDVARITAPVLAIYGDTDERINAGLPALKEALRAVTFPYEIQVYPSSGHAFHNHTSDGSYNAEQASRAWAAALRWLHKHLD